MDKQTKTTWEQGKNCENDFWEKWILTKGDRWPEDFESRMDPNLVVSDLIAKHLTKTLTTPKVLDVGAGPLSCVGKILPDGRRIDLTPIDPLAKKYSAMLKQAEIKPLVETLSGEVEKLDFYFPPNTFDLVFMRNALDHSYDPILGIKQMIGVVKKGGMVILLHSTNEAEKQEYYGLHQWNICVENNEFIFWNKTVKINASAELKNIASINAIGDSDSTLVHLEKL